MTGFLNTIRFAFFIFNDSSGIINFQDMRTRIIISFFLSENIIKKQKMLSFVFGRCDSYKELCNFQVPPYLFQKKLPMYTQKSQTYKRIMQIFKFDPIKPENYQTEQFQKICTINKYFVKLLLKNLKLPMYQK